MKTTAIPKQDDARAVHLIDDKTDKEIPSEGTVFSPDEIAVGNILTVPQNKKKQHFIIKRIDLENASCIYVSPATSNLLQVLFLLGSLAATWFVLDYFISG